MVMSYPLPELIDRQTILQLKIERIPHEAEHLKKEFALFEIAVFEMAKELKCPRINVVNWYLMLYEINKRIWDLEAGIRKGDLGGLTMAQVGEIAIKIRKTNGERVRVKAEITRVTGSGFPDIKTNHCSEDVK